jgi:hypothetical protein
VDLLRDVLADLGIIGVGIDVHDRVEPYRRRLAMVRVVLLAVVQLALNTPQRPNGSGDATARVPAVAGRRLPPGLLRVHPAEPPDLGPEVAPGSMLWSLRRNLQPELLADDPAELDLRALHADEIQVYLAPLQADLVGGCPLDGVGK